MAAIPNPNVTGARGARQATPAQRESGDPDRKVHREQIGPARHRQDAGRDGGTDGRGNRHHHRVDPDAAAELLVRIDKAHQRGVDAHDAGRAKPLQDARDGEEQQRMRQRAEQRGEGEQHQPRQVDATVADDLAE
jgi:hypothetical protein